MTVSISCKKCGVFPCNCEERKKTGPFSDGLSGEPVRLACGEGKIGVNEGTCDGVPALVLTSDGTGIIGGTIDVEMPRHIEPDIELVTITFTKVESVDVFIRALEGIRKKIAT